jgi:predicted naringenin-chalcone synthase
MSFVIRGLGTALPPTVVSQAEAEAVTRNLCRLGPDESALLATLYRHTGIRERHVLFDRQVVRDVIEGTRHSGSVFLPSEKPGDLGPTTSQRMAVYEEHALPLAERAARAALEPSGVRPGDVTHLVTVSCTGFSAPGVDIALIKRLGLGPGVQRTHVGFMGCHGALNGLRVAAAYTGADPAACVLLCAVELCSLHFHYQWNPKRLVANALFADAAGAVVGTGGPAGPDGWRVAASGSCLFPDSEYAMTWDIGDHGFDMTLSTRVPNLIRANLRPWLENWLGGHGLTLGQIASWAVHPGGPRVLTDIEVALGLTAGATDVSREVLAECGNVSSATVVFLLERLRRQNAPRPCVALGFGPGLVVEAALFVL